MKATVTVLLSAVLMLIVYAPAATMETATQSQKPGHELVQSLLELYDDPDYKVRLQAYFVTAGVPPYPELIAKLREQQAKGDAAEKAVISYALAVITRAPQDINAFLDDFPLDECTYNNSFYAYHKIEFMILQVQFFLRDLAYEKKYAERAKYLFWVMFYNPEMVHPRSPNDDTLLNEYFLNHEHTDFILKKNRNCICKEYSELSTFPSLIDMQLLNLVQSDDFATRGAVQAISFFFLRDRDKLCEQYYRQAQSFEELFFVKNVICPFSIDQSVDFYNKNDVILAFKYAYNVYNNPMINFFEAFDIEDCSENVSVCDRINLIRKYAYIYLNDRQKYIINNVIKINGLME